ncbi:BRCA1 carboxy-terminus (BRCT) domain protein [Rhizoctonia solani]|uniref:BRCA1 carboxy-terminus (BRCT) domain protein n=1 Tax=Rhizoctonia solani TaxID=456999 RepID=A0A8H8NUQ7_9AGAM|nr:BRCA1 carboxy-terminus (BRCT) domain protein [Rhizoctonia solani]QRW19117.1 BRCA1 carboxy-terminus (BRCT) domain protein [Rhizoctonia solani]
MSNIQNPENKKLSDFKVLNFDVYGTLIDWESGVIDGIEPLLNRSNETSRWTRREKLDAFEEVESELQRQHPDMIYSDILANTHKGLAASSPYSNVDNETFKHTVQKLDSEGAKFSQIVTAQDVGSYKPDERNFLYALKEIKKNFGIEKEEVLVTAQSLFHDHAPANNLGLKSSWIARENVTIGRNSPASYTFKFVTLGAMADAAEAEFENNHLVGPLTRPLAADVPAEPPESKPDRKGCGRGPAADCAGADTCFTATATATAPTSTTCCCQRQSGAVCRPHNGAPLSMYVEKDVPGRDEIIRLIEKHSGVVATAYSTVPYILVDPTKESGQNLYRQYSAKRGKTVLNAQWVHACITAGQLQTFRTNYAGFKVDGTEHPESPRAATRRRRRTDPAPPPGPAFTAQIQYQQWPEHPHYPTQPQQPYYTGAPPPTQWATNQQYPALTVPVIEGSAYPPYPGYPGDEQGWAAPGEDAEPSYYDHFQQLPYEYIPAPAQTVAPSQPENPSQSPEPAEPEEEEEPRGRKRTRSGRTRNVLSEKVDPQKLVSARGPPARSPDPPARVVKSTHGGNLFTADDVQYLKSYIEYCQNQGLVLSLREICERLAVKAPHHTFYSWRRYCNKHQIRLGAYTMDDPVSEDRTGPPPPSNGAGTHQLAAPSTSVRPSVVGLGRTDRSPTPPRALYRSTTGKGIAFTETDVTFLMKFLHYRRRKNPELDMVQFWKDVAERAPHHSRASWMKYWRRHKHELEADPSMAANQPPTTSFSHPSTSAAASTSTSAPDQPLPQGPPQKRKRYDNEDDLLLARYFATGPQGTSDAIFQRFAQLHPHHPWKGWQEHHRIHKNQIDHLMKKILATNAAAAMAAGAQPPGSTNGVGEGLRDFGLDAMEG